MTLERIEHKVFASEAPLEEMGQFGSALATTKFNTKDVAEIQALPAYTQGWGSAIISENNYPAMEEMNGVLNVMSYHTGYLYQEGIPTYSSTQEYSVTSWVKDLAGEKVYKSLQDGNKGHSLTDPAWWMELNLGGVSSETLEQFVLKDSLVEVQTVIETYVNGDSWYRIWSPDSTGKRWCQQGGSGSHNRDTQLVVSLLKPFATTDYNITTSFQTTSNVAYNEYVLNYSTDSITFWSYGPITKFWWRAEGYIK